MSIGFGRYSSILMHLHGFRTVAVGYLGRFERISIVSRAGWVGWLEFCWVRDGFSGISLESSSFSVDSVRSRWISPRVGCISIDFDVFCMGFGRFRSRPANLVVLSSRVKQYFRSQNGQIVLYVFPELAARSDYGSNPY